MVNRTDQEISIQGTEAAWAVFATRSGRHPLVLRVASGFMSRFRGLMLTRPLQENHGLLIPGCSSVHSAFMRYAIDVVYVDEAGVAQKCVRAMKPWRASIGNFGRSEAGRDRLRVRHTLELAAGSIARMDIRAGDRLLHPLFYPTRSSARPDRQSSREKGSAMTEFVVVGPIISLLGLAILQYGMLFFAKAQINHASFMAARAGSTGNASLEIVRAAYTSALVPLYGGGQNAQELAVSLGKATADLAGNVRIELLNPTKESFDDWGDPALQAALATGSRKVIPNSNQGSKEQGVGPASGQTIQDANLIKLRITQGYLPKVPIIANIYRVYLKWLDPGTDSFHSQLVGDGRIPVVSSVTMQMQSDAIEGDAVSIPGKGNGGKPVDPGDPPVVETPPPDCANVSCTRQPLPQDSPADPPSDPGRDCTGGQCPPCSQT